MDRIAPYQPVLLRRWMADAPAQRWREEEASVVFVDVSGFTQLSERLARLGKIGAEELSAAIGGCFTQLLAVAYAEGGSLLKFGGDALLLLFTGEDHARRACRSAAEMRQTLRKFGAVQTVGGTVRLRMSVGVHSGTFHMFLVGRSHPELVLAGPSFSEVVRLEGAARAGEILLSPATAAAIDEPALLRPHPAGVLLRATPRTTAAPVPAPVDGGVTNGAVEAIPIALREHILAGVEDPEHRRVTVAFLHFDGTDAFLAENGPAATADALDELVGHVQRVVDQHEITFLGTDVDLDGGKLILAAGTPVSHGDDEERMLLALHGIMSGDRPLPLRGGVNQGHVFAGDIGPVYRRTYTVMGDAVNLAARLMAAADRDQVLTTDEVARASRTQFLLTPLPPLQVKGKRRPVQAHRIGPPIGTRTRHEAGMALVGRDDELDRLRRWVRAAALGTGRVIEVLGEPGMGKSRVVDELRRDGSMQRVISVMCQRHEAANPYTAARQLLREALNCPDDQATVPEEVLRAAAETCCPELLPWLPLLGPVVGLELAPTPQTAQLEPQFLRRRLHRTVTELLAAILDAPTLVTIEDAHWMDEASVDLIRDLVRDVGERPWAVCVTRREVDSGFVAEDAATTHRLSIGPLTTAAAHELVTTLTAHAPLPGHVAARLVERADGNPMYLAELVLAASNAGGLDELPDSLETLLSSRIDRLSPDDRAGLRRMAVLGQSFDRALAGELLGPDVDGTLGRLGAFIDIRKNVVVFRHALVWESAYESLPFGLRRRLHEEVADALGRIADGEPEAYAEALSFQCLHAGRYRPAWSYSLIAAERAAHIYANPAAAVFYERAIAAARALGDLPSAELAAAFEALGDVRDRMGAFATAGASYRAARGLLAGRPVDEARLLLKFAWEQGRLRRYSQALRWTMTGLRLLDGRPDQAAAGQRAQLLVWYGRFRQEQGRHRDAIAWSRRSIPVARAAGERDALAHAYKILDRAYMYLGEPERAVHATSALELYEALGDLGGQASVLNSMGAFAYWQGRWSEALELYRRAHDLWVRTGDEDGVAFAKANTAEVLSDQGRLAEAERLFREALRIWESAGHRSHVALVKSDLARVATRAGRHDEAARLFAEARAGSEEVGARADVLETDVRVAESLVLQGKSGAGLDMVNAHLTGVGSSEVAAHPALLRVRGYALLQTGDLARARDALQASLAAAEGRDAAYEVALTLRALAVLADLDGVDDARPLRGASDDILRRLDVVMVRDVPLPEGTPRGPDRREPAGVT